MSQHKETVVEEPGMIEELAEAQAALAEGRFDTVPPGYWPIQAYAEKWNLSRKRAGEILADNFGIGRYECRKFRVKEGVLKHYRKVDPGRAV